MSTELAQANTALARPGMLRPIAKPQEAIEIHKEVVQFVQQALEPGKDIGVIPGTDDKMNLLLPGAQRLCGGFGLRPEFEAMDKEVDHSRETPYEIPKWIKRNKPSNAVVDDMKAKGIGRNKNTGNGWVWQEKEIEVGKSQGLYRYVIRCRLFAPDGREVGQGVGSCSSLESKYIRTPRDFENTILKMAKKRAFVDATLTTLGLSDRFTQDIEDIQDNHEARDRHVEPEEGPRVNEEFERVKGEKDWMSKTLNMLRRDFDQYTERCKSLGVDPYTLSAQARAEGVETKDQMFEFLASKEQERKQESAESDVIDAEVIPDPKSPATSATGERPKSEPHRWELTASEARKLNTACGVYGKNVDEVKQSAWDAGIREADALIEFAQGNP